MSDDRVKRAYHSPLRAQRAAATRRRIRLVGKRLFLGDGYLATPMSRIATEAGVAERTLYLAFPTKAALLNEIIRVTVRGHDGDEPLASGAEFRSVFSAPPSEMLARFAATTASLMSRTARVLALGEAAADSDPAVAAFRDRGHAATRSDLRDIASALRAAGQISPQITPDQAADAIYAIAADQTLFLRLTDECSWTPTQYAELLERLLAAALAPPRTE
jgi:AcrR family transcriptional regulator